jgi:hypothetical protein
MTGIVGFVCAKAGIPNAMHPTMPAATTSFFMIILRDIEPSGPSIGCAIAGR